MSRVLRRAAGRRVRVSGRTSAAAGAGGAGRRAPRGAACWRRAGGGLLAYVLAAAAAGRRCAGHGGLLAARAAARAAAPAPPDRPTLTFLSVGGGPPRLLQVPGGPTDSSTPGRRRSRRRCVGTACAHIDLLVLSHGHADHVAGLEDVIGRVPVGAALLPRPPAVAGARRPRRGSAAGTDARACATPAALRAGAVSLQVLPTSPPTARRATRARTTAPSSPSSTSAGHGARARRLRGRGPAGCSCRGDVVELPHHGSRGGLDPALLARLPPRLGVISVGPNSYGHPTAEMLDLLAAAGVPCRAPTSAATWTSAPQAAACGWPRAASLTARPQG